MFVSLFSASQPPQSISPLQIKQVASFSKVLSRDLLDYTLVFTLLSQDLIT